MQTGIFFEDTIYFSGTAQEDVGNIKLIEEYIVSMATTLDKTDGSGEVLYLYAIHNKPPDKVSHPS